MRIMTLPVLLMMIMGLAQEPTINNDVDLGQEFKIKNGQEVVVRGEKLRINFVGVVDESRCPTGAVCVWEGNAVVVLDVSKKNKKRLRAVLNTRSEGNEVTYKQFRIRLVALSPYPKINEPIDPKDYEAALIVTKEE